MTWKYSGYFHSLKVAVTFRRTKLFEMIIFVTNFFLWHRMRQHETVKLEHSSDGVVNRTETAEDHGKLEELVFLPADAFLTFLFFNV